MKNRDDTSRKQSLRLIYLYKLVLLTYIFFITTFTNSFEDIEKYLGIDVGNIVSFFTLLILLKDKLEALFINKNKPMEFKIQIENVNNIEEVEKEEESLIENDDKLNENSEEIEEKEESVTVEKNNTFVEPAKYDSSTINQPSDKYIRTHKIPNNKRIYRFRKKKMKNTFFNK